MRVLCVDPGLATGLALLEFDRNTALITSVEPLEMDVRSCWSYIYAKLPECDAVVCETFTITAATGKKTQQPWSLWLIGLLQAECWRLKIPIYMQKPGEAMEFEGTPSKAKTFNLWVRGGEGHAKMAVLHMIYYLVIRSGCGLAILRNEHAKPMQLRCYTWDEATNMPRLAKHASGDE